MKSKLENFPSVNYPSLRECPERRAFMQSQFDKYGITNTNCYLTDRYEKIKDQYTIHSAIPHEGYMPGITLSFLTLIKNWYDKNEEEYAIFCDDDTEFLSIDYWTFTWDEFVNNLPEDWECVQLFRVKHWMGASGSYVVGDWAIEIPKLQLREKMWDDWGTTFLLKRSYAKKILDRHYISPIEYSFDVPCPIWQHLYPLPENILYRYLGKVYNFPLFAEKLDLLTSSSTCNPTHNMYNIYENAHINSYDYIKVLWKTQHNIKDLLIPQKFAFLTSINYTSLIESEDRRNFMNSQIAKYGIDKANVFLAKRLSEHKEEFNYTGKHLWMMDDGGIGAVLSHLSLIKNWYDNTTEPYALFCEDDIDLSTSEHWSFTWDEFVAKLPKDWECVQLIRIKNHSKIEVREKLNFRDRYWDDWGATYLLTRDYARKIINQYCHGDGFVLDVPGCDIYPIIENVLYCGLGKVYNCPLFIESVKLPTTFLKEYEKTGFEGYDVENAMKGDHYISSNYYKDFWKVAGPHANLKKIMGEYYND